MNTTTINISLPKNLYADAKKIVAQRGYTSLSELIRDALRGWVYPDKYTVNGFTPEFEEKVLKSEKSPRKNDRVWNGKTSFSKFVLDNPPKDV
jgi:hypothetical protein